MELFSWLMGSDTHLLDGFSSWMLLALVAWEIICYDGHITNPIVHPAEKDDRSGFRSLASPVLSVVASRRFSFLVCCNKPLFCTKWTVMLSWVQKGLPRILLVPILIPWTLFRIAPWVIPALQKPLGVFLIYGIFYSLPWTKAWTTP